MKNLVIVPIVYLALASSLVQANPRRLDMGLDGQLASAVEELKGKLQADPDTQGRKLRIGKFTGPNLPDSNFDLGFEQKLRELLSDLLADESPLVVNGEYRFLPGEVSENKDLEVIQVVVSVQQRFRVLQSVTREINRSEDIARITGTTVTLPDTADIDKRNEKVKEALFEPEFGTRNIHEVTAKDQPDYAVAIQRREGGQGDPLPVIPDNVNGFAFVELKVTDTFSIQLMNYDQQSDALAVIRIDGLDVANTFSEDGVKYQGYLVSRAKGSAPGEYVVPGWLKTTKSKTGNVFEFVVNELGKGAATEMKSRDSLGVIHVEFFEATPPEESLPSRSFGEIGRGRPLDVAYELKNVQRRQTPIASVSIRYRRPE